MKINFYMTNEEYVKLVGDAMSEMGIKRLDILKDEINNNKDVLEYYFRKVKNQLNRGGEYTDSSPSALSHVFTSGTIEVRYNIDNVDVILHVPEKYQNINKFINEVVNDLKIE